MLFKSIRNLYIIFSKYVIEKSVCMVITYRSVWEKSRSVYGDNSNSGEKTVYQNYHYGTMKADVCELSFYIYTKKKISPVRNRILRIDPQYLWIDVKDD